MNKQGEHGIEWTHVFGPGTGYTWNVGVGCKHQCAWTMPNGTRAECYAKAIVDRFDQHLLSTFEEYHFHEDRLREPFALKSPSGIFLDSMSDLMGHWVTDAQINQVFDVVRRTPQHVYFLLTKNAKRLPSLDFPPNCWVGISAPPSFMWGKELTREQQVQWMTVACQSLQACNARIRWLSAEPLSFNLSPAYGLCRFDWVVIGAASRGKTYFQPDPSDVVWMLREADARHIPVFFKGNLKWTDSPWRNAFPAQIQQLSLF